MSVKKIISVMKHLKLFEDFSKKENIIKEYDPRYNITYLIDTTKNPEDGDRVLDTDGDVVSWSEDIDIVGVIVKEIEGDPYNLSQSDDDIKYNSQSSKPNFNKRDDLIDIPEILNPEFECTKEITLKDYYHRPINIKVSDRIVLSNYLHDKGNYAKSFMVTSLNGEKVESWITIEALTDNFKLV
jgi:hypothetical protein